jgi:hypothetical protein
MQPAIVRPQLFLGDPAEPAHPLSRPAIAYPYKPRKNPRGKVPWGSKRDDPDMRFRSKALFVQPSL